MDVFDETNMSLFKETLSNIYQEYSSIVSTFGGNISDYISYASNPYDVSVSVRDLVPFIEKYFLEISVQTGKIFRSTHELDNTIEDFNTFYSFMLDAYKGINDKSKYTNVIAAVLIFMVSNIKDDSTSKVANVILKSMCNMPSVGILVHASAKVLGDYF